MNNPDRKINTIEGDVMVESKLYCEAGGILCSSVELTRKFGARLARSARRGDVFGLVGDLGTGKTEFVRGFVAALSANCIVRSPTFSLLNIYKTPFFPVYHFDFYRLSSADELVEIGFEEYVKTGDGVCIIEWANLFPEVIPSDTILVTFKDYGHDLRLLQCQIADR